MGGGFGGIAQFSRGNGREISSRQQIVQHPQPKRKTEQNKKVQIVKGKNKTLIISFKVTDSYFQSIRSAFVSFFFSENWPAPTLDGKDAVRLTYVAKEQNSMDWLQLNLDLSS